MPGARSGYADDETIEIVELPGHPFLLATLFQPQVSSDDTPLHPLLIAFSKAIVTHHLERAVEPQLFLHPGVGRQPEVAAV